jgi:hypothetical protein
MRRALLIAAAAAGAALVFVPAAGADVKIRQIHPSTGALGGEWVELQFFGTGSNQISGRLIRTYGTSGEDMTSYTIPGNAANTQSQRTVLISSLFTPAGVSADFVASVDSLQMTGMEGAVCLTQDNAPSFTPIDCVSYGNFGGAIPSAGTPAVATPFEQTLERSITRGCKTALDAADDTDNSAADFALSTNPPRNNSTAPTEKVCPGAPGTTGLPNTKIKKRPKNRSDDVSPTFKFKSTESGSKFKCKLDHKKFKRCKSPKTYHGLDPGKHTFKVRATDADGNADKTPAKDKFRVLP